MDLQTLKNNYAKEQGYDDWNDLSEKNNYADDYELHWTSVCIRAQKAALEKAAENVKMKRKDNWFDLHLFDDWSEIDRNSITNPENLIL